MWAVMPLSLLELEVLHYLIGLRIKELRKRRRTT
jgi:hypothetical protein